MITLTSKPITKTQIAKQPVVVLSLKQWAEIEKELENAEMICSSFFVKEIKKTRKEKIVYSSSQIKKKLGL